MKPFRMLVTGGRDFIDRDLVFQVLNDTVKDVTAGRGIEVICGDASGVDRLALEWSRRCTRATCTIFRADWRGHQFAAGALRNQQMVDTKPDVCVAFPGGKSTADCVRKAKRAGLLVFQVTLA